MLLFSSTTPAGSRSGEGGRNFRPGTAFKNHVAVPPCPPARCRAVGSPDLRDPGRREHDHGDQGAPRDRLPRGDVPHDPGVPGLRRRLQPGGRPESGKAADITDGRAGGLQSFSGPLDGLACPSGNGRHASGGR